MTGFIVHCAGFIVHSAGFISVSLFLQSFHFRKPVNSKLVPDYYNVIKFPMDLQTMKEVSYK